MELKFIGMGSALNPDINNSAYFINNENLCLIDCGENVFSEILKIKLLENVKNVYLFITHTHSDHVGSIGTLSFFVEYFKKVKLKIVTDKNYKIKKDIDKLLKIFGATKLVYEFVDKKETYSDLGLDNIEFIKVKHFETLKSYAFVFTRAGKSICFSGDTCDLDFVKSIIKRKDVEKFYLETASYGGVHMKYDDIKPILENEKDRIVFMHLESDVFKLKLIQDGFKVAK